MRRVAIVCVILGLAGCGGSGPFGGGKPAPETVAAADPAADQTRPRARPGTLDTTVRKPPETARTVEDFDTTTDEQRAAAAADTPEPAAEQALGETVASLGDVAQPGFWLKTPLVSSPGKGRVLFAQTGKTAQVDLIPIDGPATAGSRMSLAAMRLLGAPLTGLPTVDVFLLP